MKIVYFSLRIDITGAWGAFFCMCGFTYHIKLTDKYTQNRIVVDQDKEVLEHCLTLDASQVIVVSILLISFLTWYAQ